MQRWLSNKVLGWAPDNEGGSYTDNERLRRPHEIFAHAENVLGTKDSEFAVADSIFALKRAINSRLQHIEELYRLSTLFPKSVGALERLEYVGLARPMVVKQLFELRNDIEHNDVMPPNQQRARELIDATWYFLRTTDSACKMVPDRLLLRSAYPGTFPPEQWITLCPSRDGSNRFDIVGWVSEDLLAEVDGPDSFKLELEKLGKKPSGPPPGSDDEIANWAHIHNSARGDNERAVIGKAILSNDIQREYWRLVIATT
ncbi:hypothetical protein SAMN05216350_101268 [Polaromonas sp. YR568]|uniref:hypothetical protein n=1 Tax=Polaromonas sp. YR568 TaxID=1855301 RepID=UPI0008F40ED8|nr:hypothetical protein [Polaromonas sp. YR568]SFU31426.1 hypothetical protein SAMN05216350_101268 [Polaromonas sp. YR568]